MVIKEQSPITLAEVVELAGNLESGKKIKEFIRKFNKMPVSKAKEMKKELGSLDLIRLKDFHIVKIVDFMPEDASELNKVVIDVSLDQEEITKILDVVKKYK